MVELNRAIALWNCRLEVLYFRLPGRTGCFPSLVGEGLGGAKTGQGRFNFCIDVADFLFDLFGGGGHALALGGHHQGKKWAAKWPPPGPASTGWKT